MGSENDRKNSKRKDDFLWLTMLREPKTGSGRRSDYRGPSRERFYPYGTPEYFKREPQGMEEERKRAKRLQRISMLYMGLILLVIVLITLFH
jgi:hypothetical protein